MLEAAVHSFFSPRLPAPTGQLQSPAMRVSKRSPFLFLRGLRACFLFLPFLFDARSGDFLSCVYFSRVGHVFCPSARIVFNPEGSSSFLPAASAQTSMFFYLHASRPDSSDPLRAIPPLQSRALADDCLSGCFFLCVCAPRGVLLPSSLSFSLRPQLLSAVRILFSAPCFFCPGPPLGLPMDRRARKIDKEAPPTVVADSIAP